MFAAFYRARLAAGTATKVEPVRSGNALVGSQLAVTAPPPSIDAKYKRKSPDDDEHAIAARRDPKVGCISRDTSNTSGHLRPRRTCSRKVNYNEDALFQNELERVHASEELTPMSKTTRKRNLDRRAVYIKKETRVKDTKNKMVTKMLVNSTKTIRHHKAADESTLPGLGWELGTINGPTMTRVRTCWISPTRKIHFRKLKDAILFESLRQSLGTDEVEAWEEYSKMKAPYKAGRSVVQSRKFDSPGKARSYVSQNPLLLAGWQKKVVKQHAGITRFHWLSPVRNIEFRFAKAAREFEELRRQMHGNECRAWEKFVQIKKREKKAGVDLSLGVVGGQRALGR